VLTRPERTRRIGLAVTCAVLLLASIAPTAGAEPLRREGPPAGPAGNDRSRKVFDPRVTHEIAFEIAPEDLPKLQYGVDERVPARMTFDGRTLESVGVRLKHGFGSFRALDGKAGFSIKTDEFVDNRLLYGVARFTLGNAVFEPSFVTESLAYDVFRSNRIPAPRTALARVTLNGEAFGLYVMRETYDRRFLARHFSNPDGNLYEAPFDADVSDPRLELRTNEGRNDKSDIERLARVLATTPDDELLAAVGKLVDVDELFRYWAVEAIVGSWDGYVASSDFPVPVDDPSRVANSRPNNYYVYHDLGKNKLLVLPWGADASFGTGVRTGNPSEMKVLSPPKANATLAARLYALPGGPERLRAAIGDVLDHGWHPDALLARADGLAELVRANGLTSPREENTIADFEAALAARRRFVLERDAAVRAELGTTP
jgi:spore coat protein CotH